MRVISMQSPEVWEILKRDRIYRADINMCRERASYAEDIKNLGGLVPIWCWAYPDLSFRTLFNGEVLEYLRCEMSLGQDNCWEPFIMLELEISDNLLLKGIHHNDCPYSKVFGELHLDMLKAVYKLEDSPDEGWYFKVITPIWIKDPEDCITNEILDCRYWDMHADTVPEKYFSGGYSMKQCLHCGRWTFNVHNNKHLCSLNCMFKNQRHFMISCSQRGMDANKAVELYNTLTDEELSEGVYQYVKNNISIKA